MASTKRQRIDLLIERGNLLANQETSSEPPDSPQSCATAPLYSPRRSSWTSQEDDKLRKLVHQLGPSKWSEIAKQFPLRDRKRCRERYVNHLAPSLLPVLSAWSFEDDERLLQLQRTIGCKWAKIAEKMDGKSAASVKNRSLLLARRESDKQYTVRKALPQRWLKTENDKLRHLVATHGAKNWLFIASQLPRRTDVQCIQQWYRIVDDKVVKGKGM